MFKVQLAQNQTSFGERHRLSREEIEARRQREELMRQRMELEAIAHDKDSPNALKKIARAGVLLTAGAAVGLTAGGGTKILIDKAAAFKNSKFVNNVKETVSSYAKAFKDAFDAGVKKFKKAMVYKKASKSVNSKINNFKESKFGKPIAKYAGKGVEIAKQGVEKLNEGCNWIKEKFSKIKPETLKKAIVGTVGASSGTCAVINQIKEDQEAE